ncbi:hypothetical protein CIHG_10161 [Coccidioides immitis H538.4]|uniref:Uncharacterized protein n=1 Tax=Coccidioides immitis H538.4 TaxID=396776 RepID=A0A0J8UWN3_COCIT|nr:hypothetical protein CIHG_10161 [Coccidioides immitis H538.4]
MSLDSPANEPGAPPEDTIEQTGQRTDHPANLRGRQTQAGLPRGPPQPWTCGRAQREALNIAVPPRAAAMLAENSTRRSNRQAFELGFAADGRRIDCARAGRAVVEDADACLTLLTAAEAGGTSVINTALCNVPHIDTDGWAELRADMENLGDCLIAWAAPGMWNHTANGARRSCAALSTTAGGTGGGYMGVTHQAAGELLARTHRAYPGFAKWSTGGQAPSRYK